MPKTIGYCSSYVVSHEAIYITWIYGRVTNYDLFTKLKYSARVCLSVSNEPRRVLVTVLLPAFSTPLITMHMCLTCYYKKYIRILSPVDDLKIVHINVTHATYVASIVTPTPKGEIDSMIALAICLVSRSCTCNLLANRFAIRASLLSPRIFPCGI